MAPLPSSLVPGWRWRAADLRPHTGFAGRRSYHRVALSPDEQLVAFAVQPLRYDLPETASWAQYFLPSGAPRALAGAELYLTNPEDGAGRVLTPGWGTSWGPCWSPDGRRLAFYSDRGGTARVWVWERADGRTSLACPEAATLRFGLEGMRWLPDSRRLAVKLRSSDGTMPAEEPGLVRQVKGRRDVWMSPPDDNSFQGEQEGIRWFDVGRGDLAVIDVETETARRVATGIVPGAIAVSPDGRYIAALCSRGELGERRDLNVSLADLRVFAVDGSGDRLVASRVAQAYATDFSWSPRGDALAYTALDGAPGRPGRLVVAGPDGRAIATFGGTGDRSFGKASGFAPPLWSADGEKVFAYGGRAGVGTVYAVTLATGTVRDLGAPLGRVVDGMVSRAGDGVAPSFGQPGTVLAVTLHPTTRRAGLFRLGDDAPTPIIPERGGGLREVLVNGDVGRRLIIKPTSDGVYALDVLAGEGRRLLAFNPHLERLPRLVSELIPMPGLQGEALHAAVWLPAGYEAGRRYPTVVEVYLGQKPGPSTTDPDRLPLAAAGYLVVKPDMPHSPEHGAADLATFYALRALDAAVAAGLADPERAAVFGHSCGGYDVCCIVTRTDRFRAAVAVAPFADLVSFALRPVGNRLGATGEVEGGHVRTGGAYWQHRERYLANSPVYHLDRVTTPLLLLCGTADPLIAQAEEVYGGLLRLGKVATLVRYHAESHVPSSGWSDDNYEDYWARIVAWLDRYIRGARRET